MARQLPTPSEILRGFQETGMIADNELLAGLTEPAKERARNIQNEVESLERDIQSSLDHINSMRDRVMGLLAHKNALNNMLIQGEALETIKVYLQGLIDTDAYIGFIHKGDCIIGVSSEVKISWRDRDYYLGYFKVVVNLKRNSVRIYPFFTRPIDTPHLDNGDWIENHQNYFHPHVRKEGSPCLGNISQQIPDLIRGMQIGPVFEIMWAYLNSYNNDSPYFSLDSFVGDYESKNYPGEQTGVQFHAALLRQNEPVSEEEVEVTEEQQPEEEQEVMIADLQGNPEEATGFMRLALQEANRVREDLAHGVATDQFLPALPGHTNVSLNLEMTYSIMMENLRHFGANVKQCVANVAMRCAILQIRATQTPLTHPLDEVRTLSILEALTTERANPANHTSRRWFTALVNEAKDLILNAELEEEPEQETAEVTESETPAN